MAKNKQNSGFGENIPDPEEIRELYPIEDDRDSLEPFVDEDEHRAINSDDPADVARWAERFQIPVDELRAAIVLNGTSVREIKKYLSV